MNNQLNLFDVCAGRHRGNEQSRAANKIVKKDAYYRSIVMYLERAGERGATTEEMAAAFGVGPHCISGRVTELLAAEIITRAGDTRPTKSGSPASVHRLKRNP